ncbi:hypothetical protein C8R44DRAFT_866378 [Mycena epipterygia]|nr:hypothetical protein C8R44DRAFT_866378 [Mycena epipterygia]
MHAALHLKNISGLPIPVRTWAAAAANGSMKDLLLLRSRFKATDFPSAHNILLLPVFYAILNPEKIPSVDTTDTASLVFKTAGPRVGLAFLYQLVTRGIPPDTFPELWMRVWPWTSFLDRQSYTQPGMKVDIHGFNPEIMVGFFLIGALHGHPQTRRLIYSTPGVPVVAVKIWKMSLRPGNQLLANTAFMELCKFIAHCRLKELEQSRFDEFVEGAGGDLRDLSSLVVRHIELISCSDVQVGVTPQRIEYFLDCVFTFLINADIRGTPFFDALIADGIVTALTSAVRGLEMFHSSDAWKGWKLLEWALTGERGYMRVAEALRGGLLYAMVSGCNHHRTCNTIPSLFSILANSLLPSTVYYSVLVHIKSSPDDTFFKAVSDAEFRSSDLYKPWEFFDGLIKERIKLLDWFDSRECEPCKGCDNVVCGTIQEKSKFMRCSGCLSVYYCSRECQIRDWGHRDHRAFCAKLRNFRLRENEDLITARDRSFMRALLHYDYQAAKAEIYSRQIALLIRGEPFFTLFDYTRGYPTIEFLPATNPIGTQASKLTNFVWRENESAGRMKSHFMLVGQSSSSTLRIIPMRSNGSRIQDEMKRIASKFASLAGWDDLKMKKYLEKEGERLAKDQTVKEVYIH